MSKETLPPKMLKYYLEILEEEKKEIKKLITNITTEHRKGVKDSSGDLSSFSIHLGDMGSETENMEKDAYFMEKLYKNLKMVNEAIKRVHEKTYGLCKICGEQISEARLKALPTAQLCVKCKSLEEGRVS